MIEFGNFFRAVFDTECTTTDNQVFTQHSDESVDETTTSTQGVDVKTIPELFFKSLGQLCHCSDKIMNLVTRATNSAVIHYTSAFMEIKYRCKEILALAQQTHDKAEIKLDEITSIPDESFSTSKQQTLVEHDPAGRQEKLRECQIKYLIRIKVIRSGVQHFRT